LGTNLQITGTDINESSMPASSMLIKIHGSNPLPTETKNNVIVTLSALSSTVKGFRYYPNLREFLLRTIDNKILVIIGYSCSDDFDITPLLLETKPRKVLYLEYSHNDDWPSLCDKSSNSKINLLRDNLPVYIYTCKPIGYLEFVAKHYGFAVIYLKSHLKS
jgi:hypothetical protein